MTTSSRRPVGDLIELVLKLREAGAVQIIEGDFSAVFDPTSPPPRPRADPGEDEILEERRGVARARAQTKIDRDLFAASEGDAPDGEDDR